AGTQEPSRARVRTRPGGSRVHRRRHPHPDHRPGPPADLTPVDVDQRGARRLTRAASALAAAALVLAGCVGHSRTDDDYRRKATKTVEVASSSAQTVLVA